MRLFEEDYWWWKNNHNFCRCWIVLQDLFRTRYAPHLLTVSEPKIEQEPKPKRQSIANFFTECREIIDGIRKILKGTAVKVDIDSEPPVLIKTEVVDEPVLEPKVVEDPESEPKVIAELVSL